MKKTSVLKSAINILTIIVFFFFKTSAASFFNGIPSIDFNNISLNISNLSSVISVRYTEEVGRYIQLYTNPHGISQEFLGKLPLYFPFFEEKLKEKKLPDELKYIAVVESHLINNSYSPAGAAGLWQFLEGTAKSYNLRINRDYDARYSVEEATNAAFDHLKDLYDSFGDWTIALAAYNCGSFAMKKAIEKSGGSNDYWEVCKYLPEETRNYIPKYIAISYVISHFNDFGIKPIALEEKDYDLAQAIIKKQLKFKYISEITGVSVEDIRKLNRAYRKDYIPASDEGMKLILPKMAIFDLLNHESYDQMEFDKELNLNYNRYILNFFPRNIASYMLVNGLPVEHVDMLSDHYKNEVKFTPYCVDLPKPSVVPFLSSEDVISDNEDVLHYQLNYGESLSNVSAKYNNVPIVTLMKWNGYTINKLPKAGDIIKIRLKS